MTVPNALSHPINCEVDPNKSIDLYTGDLKINQLSFDGSVAIEWFPHKDVCCRIPNQSSPEAGSVFVAFSDGYSLQISDVVADEIPCEFRSGSFNSGSGIHDFSISMNNGFWLELPASENVNYVVFHVPNFSIGSRLPLGRSIKYENNTTGARRIELNSERITVTLDQAFDIDNKFKKLQKSGGYLFTHIGKIEWKEATVNLEDDQAIVAFYLWFIAGRQLGPCLTATFDGSDQKIDQRWDLRNTDMYRPNRSWAIAHDVDSLTAAFPEYVNLCSDSKKKAVIFGVIHWYVESQSDSITMNSAIVLIQTALEKIATLFLPEEDFRRNVSAATRIEKLLDACNIPNSIPVGSQLAAQTVIDDVTNLSGIVTRIRNKTAHPTERNQEVIDDFEAQAPEGIREVYEFSTWMLQLVLLHLFKYNGQYHNVVNNTDESVPWSQAGSM